MAEKDNRDRGGASGEKEAGSLPRCVMEEKRGLGLRGKDTGCVPTRASGCAGAQENANAWSLGPILSCGEMDDTILHTRSFPVTWVSPRGSACD